MCLHPPPPPPPPYTVVPTPTFTHGIPYMEIVRYMTYGILDSSQLRVCKIQKRHEQKSERMGEGGG